MTTEYSMIKELRSYYIDLSLISEIQKYIKQKAIEFDTVSDIDERYHVIIIDSIGSEKLSKIDDYHFPFFTDDIKSITINYAGMQLIIKIKLSLYRTSIEISYNGNSSREIVTGIFSGISQLLRNYKTNDYLFSMPLLLFFCAAYFTVSFIYMVNSNLEDSLKEYYIFNKIYERGNINITVILSIGLPLIYAIICSIFKSFNTFHTRHNEKLKRLGNWLIYGFLAFVIFGIIFTYIRIKALGF
jgi:hypothetical protein